jgi:LacI family transcriptional regulator
VTKARFDAGEPEVANRPTIEQLAQAAGVSVATVDRVLNRRAHVRAKTARRVHEAALEIGFHASGLIGQRIREELPEYRLGFLLLNTGQTFYGEFARQLAAAVDEASGFRGVCMIERASPGAPDEIAARLAELGSRCMAVGVVAPEHPALAAAVASLTERGIPVFSLLSDFAAGTRQAYIGVHNGKVGRTAAWMIANCARRPGKVALFVGSHRFHGHEAREMGFRAFFREEAPQFAVLDTLVNLEDARFTHDALVDLAGRHADLAGCYVAGGGMEGAISALRLIAPERRPVMICNELTGLSRAALADKVVTMVISTPIRAISREVVALMAQSLSAKGEGRFADCFLPFEIHLPESI